jgi:hypothetical protein
VNRRANDVRDIPATVAWRRLVGYLIQAFAAEAAHPLPAPPTRAQMYRALMRLDGPG